MQLSFEVIDLYTLLVKMLKKKFQKNDKIFFCSPAFVATANTTTKKDTTDLKYILTTIEGKESVDKLCTE